MVDSQRLDCHIQKLIEEGCFPSASLCIYHRGEKIYSKAFGLADPELGQAASPATRYDAASLTKIFSMSIFFRMVDRGLVSLDEPLSRYLPEFSGPRDIRESANDTTPRPDPVLGVVEDVGTITFRQLLSHSAGLGGGHMYIRAEADGLSPVQEILRMPLRYQPGTSMVYSDQDIILIGAALERMTGKPLDALVEDWVTRPLDLTSSGYVRISRGGIENAAATLLCPWRGRRIRGVVQNEDSYLMDGVAGHAGIFTTAEDTAALVQSYLSAVQGKPGLISPELARETIRLQAAAGIERRGLLWQLRTPDVNDGTFPASPQSFGHTGWTGTMVWADVERDAVFALLTNDIWLPQEKRTLFARRKSIVEYIMELADRL